MCACFRVCALVFSTSRRSGPRPFFPFTLQRPLIAPFLFTAQPVVVLCVVAAILKNTWAIKINPDLLYSFAGEEAVTRIVFETNKF